ncbi:MULTISPECIES: DUF4926 domain-containing protein [unclassified Nostoc]|uniref:DUF4926 domain-containing protein n=1 Tax=unclassified Nostoc TaxID=2593658 RepID=UPI000B95413A|nr:DUF4926 domain-containing protein [Nostoc sp. 'Peltigera membranacea cyanobiont' 232]OYE03187.1 DUF4926 domain-containing protein [Nostoc sp. 'Peltigera membranacea cyanobiont' 232]
MSKNTIKLLDVVALTIDLPEYNLYRGQVGTVVELLAGGAAFEVEFSDACGGLCLRNGRTYESVGLRPEQIMVLHFEPASPDSVPEMVTA